MANKIQVKRSAVASKVPLTTDLDLGEIAINTYDGKLYIKKNVSGTESIVQVGGASGSSVTVSTTAPSSPSAGDLWWKSDEGTLKIYYNDGNTSQWVDAATSSGGGGGTGVTDGDKGDITVSASGATWTVDNNAITNAKLRQSAGLSLIGRSASTTGDVADITGTADQVLRVAGAGASVDFGAIDVSKSAAVSGILGSANGGTANGFTKFSGPATAEKTFTLPNASATILTDNAAVTVAQGGTGVTSTTAYSILCGGTTSTGNLQSVSGVGTSGQVLTSNGASALPTWQTPSGSSIGPKSVFILYPTTSDTKVVAFYTTNSLTLSKLIAVLPGGSSTPSISYHVRYGSDVSASGTVVTSAANTVTSTSTGTSVTSFSSATISAGSFVWVEITAASGTVPNFSLTMEF